MLVDECVYVCVCIFSLARFLSLAFWEIVSRHKVRSVFTAPTAFRALKKDDAHAEWMKKYDLSHFQGVWIGGERADPHTIAWAEEALGKPIIDTWW